MDHIRSGNRLPHNIPQLQNLIKQDPSSYLEEFQDQLESFNYALRKFKEHPDEYNKRLEQVIMFMAQVANCYPKHLADFPQRLIELLEKHNHLMDNDMRMSCCRALILLRNKNVLPPNVLLELFFQLLTCDDKNLRQFLQTHIITDIKNLNAKHKNHAINSKLQNFMFSMLENTNSRAVKMSIDIMIELYKKNVWNDERTVNVIATGCFSKLTKVMVASLKFFLGKDEEKQEENSDSDDEIDPKEVMMANKFNKKTRKREKHLERIKKVAAKMKKKKSNAASYNFSALHLVRDPQGMVTKLLKQLEATTKRFEVKLMTLDVISRLIGVHELILLDFYPYIQRFLQPHQREVTRLLLFTAQASHEGVPPEDLEPLLKTIANNFITERNSSDVIAIGLNSVREICNRCPLAMDRDLLEDLAQYKTYRERSVKMAAQSLIHLFRNVRPDLLHKKHRGRPNDATNEIVPKKFGELNAKDHVPGAEILLKSKKTSFEVDSESGSDDEEWIDVSESDRENEGNDSEDDDVENRKLDDEEDENVKEENIDTKDSKERKKEQAQIISLDRILTDEDFKQIDMENIRKQVRHTSKGEKRKLEASTNNSELIKLGDIENIYKKRKHDKATRVESVRKGQEDREKFGYKDGRMNEHCSKTNREKKKTKNYQMMRHKAKGKVKRSFKEKQIALRNYLIKQKRMK